MKTGKALSHDEFNSAFRALRPFPVEVDAIIDLLVDIHYSIIGQKGAAAVVKGFIANRTSLDKRRLIIELMRDIMKTLNERHSVDCRMSMPTLASLVREQGDDRQLRRLCEQLDFPSRGPGRPRKTR